ncbi:hypothetical protein SUDANB113_07121 [Streptomyces sp. enrichment culture]
MSIRPWVIVEPPDSRGLRKITVADKTVGSAWSLRELRKILSRLGYPRMMDVEDPASICWRGGNSKTWPDRPWRRRGVSALMIAGMLGSAVLHVVIGWPDAFKALTFSQRIVGAVFVLAGLLQFGATLAAIDYCGRRQLKVSGAITLLGAFITLPTAALLAFMWLEEREYTPYLWTFIPLLPWSLWALYRLIRQKSWHGTPHPKKFAAGVAATAILTAVSLAYSTMYQPTVAPIRFILKTQFGKPQASVNLKRVAIPLKLYVKNDGGIPIYVINDDYTVWGRSIKYSTKGEGMKQWKTDTEDWGFAVDAQRYAQEGEADVIASGHFSGPGTWLDVGEEFTYETVVRLPRNANYGELEATLTMDFMRKDRGRLDDDFGIPWHSWDKSEGQYYCPPDECGEYVIYHGRVRHNNNLINVTRKPRYVTAFWHPESGLSDFISSFDFKKKAISVYREGIDEAEVAREQERYGVATITANSKILTNDFLPRSGG